MIVGGSRCAFADGSHGPCDGRLEFHHAVKQQRLKREFKYGAVRNSPLSAPPRWVPALRLEPINESDDLGRTLDDILGDTRNRVWVCSHHHELCTNGRLKVELPESVWEFARSFGLDAALENDLRRAA